MPQQTAPRARSELQALTAKRDALREQLESITSRRGELAQQRLNAEARSNTGIGGTQDKQMVREFEQRINELGTRSRALETELDKTEDAITAARVKGGNQSEDAMPAIPAVPGVPVMPPMPGFGVFAGGFPGDPQRESLLRSKYETMMFGEAATLLLLAVIGWRIVWVSAKRKFARGVEAIPGMTELRQSIDTIAVEVERISENQRYVTRMLAEGQAPAQKVDAAGKDLLKRL
jgi:hypothetical protein